MGRRRCAVLPSKQKPHSLSLFSNSRFFFSLHFSSSSSSFSFSFLVKGEHAKKVLARGIYIFFFLLFLSSILCDMVLVVLMVYSLSQTFFSSSPGEEWNCSSFSIEEREEKKSRYPLWQIVSSNMADTLLTLPSQSQLFFCLSAVYLNLTAGSVCLRLPQQISSVLLPPFIKKDHATSYVFSRVIFFFLTEVVLLKRGALRSNYRTYYLLSPILLLWIKIYCFVYIFWSTSLHPHKQGAHFWRCD